MRRAVKLPSSHSYGLDVLLNTVAGGRILFTTPDLYRVCVLAKDNKDPLSLVSHSAFMRALAVQYQKLSGDAGVPINPFQDALLKDALSPFLNKESAFPDAEVLQSTPAHTSALKSKAPARDGASPAALEPTALERLEAIWHILDDARRVDSENPMTHYCLATTQSAKDEYVDSEYAVSSSVVQMIEPHVVALQPRLRELSPGSVANLVKALAIVNYNNYHHTSLLSRRACEVAAELPLRDVCSMYFNLHKLHTQDSLQPVAHRLRACVSELNITDAFFVAQALERQTHTSPASAALVSALATRSAQLLPSAPTPAHHRALLSAMVRYSLTQHPAIAVVLADLTKRANDLSERDLLSLLRSVCDLPRGVPGVAEACPPLLARAQVLVPTMDVRSIDLLLDLLSLVPVDSTSAMQVVMARLDADAGKLTPSQMEFSLRLLSDYPPARGHVCIVSLGFAASLRAELMEAATLESILVSLARLRHWTDDFYTIAGVLQCEKGGFRGLDHFLGVLENYPRQRPSSMCGESPPAADARFVRLVHNGVLSLAPALSEQGLMRCRKAVHTLGITDSEIQQRLSTRARQLQRGRGWGGGRGGRKPRKPYDPMGELLE